MATPSAVAKRAQEADEQIRQLSTSAGPAPVTVVPPASVPSVDPEVENLPSGTAEPSPSGDGVDGGSVSDGNGGDASEITSPTTRYGVAAEEIPAAGTPENDEGADTEQDTDPAERRYQVLRGKYDQETKRSRRRIERLEDQLDQMRQLVANMSLSAAESEPKPAETPKTEPIGVEFTPLSDREREEFGPDLLDAASRHVLAQLSPQLTILNQRLDALQQGVDSASTTAKTAQQTAAERQREQVNTDLDAKIPDWREINIEEEFKDWLKQEDYYSGEPRGTLLLRAYERGDVPRVVRFFEAYKAEHGVDGEHVEEAPKKRKPRVDPSALTSPGRGRSAPRDGTQQEKITWTPNGIKMFYQDVAKGMYRDNPAERDRLEQDIFRAQRDGRVQV